MMFPDISCPGYIELVNWAIEAQLGTLNTQSVLPTGELDADSLLAILRNQEFLSEIAPCVYTGDIEDICDKELRGAIAIYLCLHFDKKSYDEATFLVDSLPEKIKSNFPTYKAT